MARIGLSKAEVFEVANKLVEESKEPTIERIRGALSTGSNTTISKYLKEWRESNKGEFRRKEHPTVPIQLLSAVESLWTTAKTRAEQEAAIIKEAADKQVANIQTILDQEIHKSKELEAKVNGLQQNLQIHIEQGEKLRNQLEQERLEKAVLKAQISGLDSSLDQLRDENAKVHQISQNLQRNWEHLEKSSQEKQMQLNAELDSLKQLSDHQIKVLTFEAQQLEQENKMLKSSILQFTKENNELQSEILDLHKQYERKVVEVDFFQKRINLFKKELEEKINFISDYERKVREFEIKEIERDTQNKSLQEEINRLKASFNLLSSKNLEIVAEKHNLEGRLHQLLETIKTEKFIKNE